MLQASDFEIGDLTRPELWNPSHFSKGLIPRDYEKYPQGFYKSAPPMDIPLIPRDQWVERIKDMDANKSRLSDIRRRSGPGGKPIPSLDQNGQGYCWAYSCTMTIMLARALMNQPYVRLSGHMVGCLVKNYVDEGGWCGLSLEFVEKNGIASVDFWEEKSMSRSNDTAAMRENAKLHVAAYSWADMSASVYDRNFTEDQAMTLLLTRTPIQGDFNHWSHSVCLMDPVLVNERKAMTNLASLDFNDPKDLAVYAAAFGKRGLNSWTDDWGDVGEFTLTGSKALLDGGVAPLVTHASLV